ncbi:hypothetical protein B566_EDAN001492 [Ephemera danica]|nr:hypothetical protein B566_EDAN001492 [Ephemera danica]
MIISVFFLLPLCVLMALYTVIARHLMADPAPPGFSKSGGSSASTPGGGTLSGAAGGGGQHPPQQQQESSNLRARRQVVLMLGTVVLSFFICLMPFRVLTLWIIVVSDETKFRLGVEVYYNLLYFCRTMLYLNSAVNPILYNLMSSKFRVGFSRLCGLRKRRRGRWRRGTGGGSEIRRLGSAGDLTLVRGEIASRSGGVGIFTRNGTLTSLSYSSFHRHHTQARHSPEFRNSSRATDVTRLSSLDSSASPTMAKEERTNNNSPIQNNGTVRRSLIIRATVPTAATSSLDKPMLTRYTMRPSFDSQPESYV